MIGDEGLKHLSKPAQQVVQQLFELSHSEKDYYRKTASIFLKANEAVCMTYIDHFARDSKVNILDGVQQVTAIEKLQVWITADLANVSADKWIAIATEIFNLLS